MIYTALVLLATAAPPPAAEVDQLWLTDLPAGQVLLVTTELRTYRAELFDPGSGEARATVSTDGRRFSKPAKIYLLGATAGRYPEMLVQMGQLRKGMRIELGLGSLRQADRALTEPVTSIRLIK